LDTPSKGAYAPLTREIIDRIRENIGERFVISDPERMDHYSGDATELRCCPELVVEPTSKEQIQALFGLANDFHFPITPRGLGTGLAGGCVPWSGGVVLSLAKMNRILSIDTENLIAIVEPGVINGDLKRAAESCGLFYPPDPASLDTCSIGGNAATNAGGASCVKYGTTRDYVLGLEAVLPSGELIQAGVRTRKGVVGYSLAQLLVGSEGTLAVITQLILRLIPRPPAVSGLVALFADLPSAMRSVTSVLTRGHIPSAMEFMDRRCLGLVRGLLPFDGLDRTGALLLIETDGTPEAVEKEMERIGLICLEGGAENVFMAPDAIKRARIWEVRRRISLRIEENAQVYIPEDVVVPIGRIADFVSCLSEIEERFDMKIYTFGHAGDGNIHLNITVENRQTLGRVAEGIRVVLEKVLAMGGTISGEHGVGLVKKRFLPLELSPVSVRIQNEIKNTFDPLRILNPGKIFEQCAGG